MIIRMTAKDLKAWRKRVGFTQADLAKALDISIRTVQEWETTRGKGKPPAYLKLALQKIECTLKKETQE